LRKAELKKAEKLRKIAEGQEILDDTERNDAILIIQKYYRGFEARE